MSSPKPIPHPNEISAPYWVAAREGRLVFQRCTRCARVRHYPQLLCGACQHEGVEWIESSRHGAVHSWTISHHAFHPAFAAEVPYALVIADMAEGVRVLGRYAGDAPLAPGLPVSLRFEADAQDTPVPVFRPLAGA